VCVRDGRRKLHRLRSEHDSDATNVTTTAVSTRPNPEAITIKEIESFLWPIVAGHETANHAIGSSIRLLLEHRSRWFQANYHRAILVIRGRTIRVR
jgi:cytochrome P450